MFINYIPAAAAPDPSVILLNFEAGLTDTSPYGRTITGHNGAVASTTRAKWGTHGITTDGTYRLQTPDAPELRLGNLEWAMECWLYVPTSVTFAADNCIACKWTTTGGTKLTIFWGIDVFGRLTVGFSHDGTTLTGGAFLVASAGAVPRDAFFHAAMWRTKASALDSTYGAINGVSHQIASTSIGTLHDNAAPVCILDTDYSPNPLPSGCSMDAFRMVTNSCPFPRGDFTPPTGPY